jgi:hypothetical protein
VSRYVALRLPLAGGVVTWFVTGSGLGLSLAPGCSSSRPRQPGSSRVDFLHMNTLMLKRTHVLVFIEHGTRRMHLGGVTASPTGEWTVQQTRKPDPSLGERLEGIKFLIATADRTSPPHSPPSSMPVAYRKSCRASDLAFYLPGPPPRPRRAWWRPVASSAPAAGVRSRSRV